MENKKFIYLMVISSLLLLIYPIIIGFSKINIEHTNFIFASIIILTYLGPIIIMPFLFTFYLHSLVKKRGSYFFNWLIGNGLFNIYIFLITIIIVFISKDPESGWLLFYLIPYFILVNVGSLIDILIMKYKSNTNYVQ